MKLRSWLAGLLLSGCFAAVSLAPASDAGADEWGRYYHWPYGSVHQYQWSPNEYQPLYDGNHRYPAEMRRFPTVKGWRNWSLVKKPYYRGYHFILDQF